MPIYDYRCDSCGRDKSISARVSEHRPSIECRCGESMRQVISAPLFHVQETFAAECPITGQIMTSHRQRNNIMAEHGYVDARDFEDSKTHIKKRLKKKAALQNLAAQLPQPPNVDQLKQVQIDERLDRIG